MALKKAITMSNGLTLEYHRIAMVKIDTNQQISILRHSYLNEAARQIEKDYAAGLITDPQWPYVDYEYMSLEYDENMNIKNAYEWLKQQPGFEGSENI